MLDHSTKVVFRVMKSLKTEKRKEKSQSVEPTDIAAWRSLASFTRVAVILLVHYMYQPGWSTFSGEWEPWD